MEWLLGLLFIWILSVFTNSTSNQHKSDDLKRKFDSNKDAGILKRLEDERLERTKRQVQLQKELHQEPIDKKPIDSDQGANVSIIRIAENSNIQPIQETLKKKSSIVSSFNAFGVHSLWHITHRDNIQTILDKGILSNKSAFESARPRDISNHDVQRWRDRIEPFNERTVHDYTPLYINVRNPMLYVRKNIKNELCIIEISLSALEDGDFVFTDGNAASRDTKFYKEIGDLSCLPWDVLRASYWSDFPDGRRKRCSEVLVYPCVDSKHILRVHCYSQQTLRALSEYKCNSLISERMFF